MLQYLQSKMIKGDLIMKEKENSITEQIANEFKIRDELVAKR